MNMTSEDEDKGLTLLVIIYKSLIVRRVYSFVGIKESETYLHLV